MFFKKCSQHISCDSMKWFSMKFPFLKTPTSMPILMFWLNCTFSGERKYCPDIFECLKKSDLSDTLNKNGIEESYDKTKLSLMSKSSYFVEFERKRKREKIEINFYYSHFTFKFCTRLHFIGCLKLSSMFLTRT
jgi:hypothetical protein